jgi:hypothetical protein
MRGRGKCGEPCAAQVTAELFAAMAEQEAFGHYRRRPCSNIIDRQRKAGQSKCYRETCYERLLLLALDFLLLMTMSCAKSVEVEIR